MSIRNGSPPPQTSSAVKPGNGTQPLRSLPFQAPPSIEAQLQRLRRFCLVLGAGLAVFVIAAAAFFLAQRSPSDRSGDEDKSPTALRKAEKEDEKEAKPRTEKRSTKATSDLREVAPPKKAALTAEG